MIIGKNLRSLRENRGISRGELAKTLGITPQQLQKYEKGSSGISTLRLLTLSRILHTPLEDFFKGAEDEYAPVFPVSSVNPAIMSRALKIQKIRAETERTKILKIIDILTA